LSKRFKGGGVVEHGQAGQHVHALMHRQLGEGVGRALGHVPALRAGAAALQAGQHHLAAEGQQLGRGGSVQREDAQVHHAARARITC
jgi:hypothetical protein